MLVCNVSLRPPRRAIAVTLAEAGAALDAPLAGRLLSALVDAPVTASSTADAYLGELMAEAASAAAVVEAGLAYAVLVDEAASITESYAGIYAAGIDADVSEAAAADAAVSATLGTARSAMLAGVFVNSGGIAREANAGGIMVNL